MQQFTVPQFIDVEDKILPFVTVRQFLLLIVAAVIGFILYATLDFAAFLTFTIVETGIIIVIAFAKVRGAPFHHFILNFLQVMIKPNIRVWNNSSTRTSQKEAKEIEIAVPEKVERKTFSKSRLNELSLIVDTQGVYRGEGESSSDQGGQIKLIKNAKTK